MLRVFKHSKRRKRRNQAFNSVRNIVKFQTLKPLEKVRLEIPNKKLEFKVKKIERNTLRHFNKNINSNIKVDFRQLVEALPKVIRTGQICKDRRERRREIFRRTRGKGLKVKKTNWNLYSYVRCS